MQLKCCRKGWSMSAQMGGYKGEKLKLMWYIFPCCTLGHAANINWSSSHTSEGEDNKMFT